MRGELLILILVLSLPLSGALEIHMEQQNVPKCPGGFDAASALTNATLYAQVYTWMHQQDVTDWNYTHQVLRIDPADNKRYSLPEFLAYYGEEEGKRRWSTAAKGTDCARVSYKTEVESPSVFARMMRSLHMFVHFPIEVHKSVCVLDNEDVLETATISLPLIHEMTMTTRYAVQHSAINTTIDASFDIPWYVDFLLLDVSHHILANFEEKVDAVAQSLCVPAPPLVGLASPQHLYLRTPPPGQHHHTRQHHNTHPHPQHPHNPHLHPHPPQQHPHPPHQHPPPHSAPGHDRGHTPPCTDCP